MSAVRLVNVYDSGRIRPGAIEFLYRLLEERAPEINISHRTMPSMEQHRAFMHRRPHRLWYIVEAPEIQDAPPRVDEDLNWRGWVGAINANDRNEIGIVLRPAFQHMGFGSAAVRELIARHQPLDPVPSARNGNWIANIAPGNEASIGMFTKLGFKLLQLTYELPPK